MRRSRSKVVVVTLSDEELAVLQQAVKDARVSSRAVALRRAIKMYAREMAVEAAKRTGGEERARRLAEQVGVVITRDRIVAAFNERDEAKRAEANRQLRQDIVNGVRLSEELYTQRYGGQIEVWDREQPAGPLMVLEAVG